MSFFEKIDFLPPDPIFGLIAEYLKDPREIKNTFITGYFRNEDLKTSLLNCTSFAERLLAEKKEAKNYLPIEGNQEFLRLIGKLIFKKQFDEALFAKIQTVGGTGALYLAARLASHWTNVIGIPNPAWPNYQNIFSIAGLNIKELPYYKNKESTFDQMMDAVNNLPKKSCILLQTNAHNPTGYDLTQEQWDELIECIIKKHLFPVLDMAYHGFSSDLEDDAYIPRLVLRKQIPFAIAYTFSKNLTIYSERTGALLVYTGDKKTVEPILSHLKKEVRGRYSNPPFHGMAIAKTILQTPQLKQMWEEELQAMRSRIQSMRIKFIDQLIEKDPKGDWQKLQKTVGLFCYPELSKEAVQFLKERHGLYFAEDGRINITGINDKNLSNVVDAIIEALS